MRPTTRPTTPLTCAASAGVLLALLAGCAATQADEYRAVIRRTSFGIPHIEAADWGSLGFGEGYAIAEDHLCSVADQLVRSRGERARYFGVGDDDEHLISDLGIAALDLRRRAGEDLAAFPPYIQDVFAGYAAGYNRYLAETGADNVDGWCRGASWVGQIESVDIVAYARSLYMISTRFGNAIVAARPPGQATAAAPGDFPETVGASNGWAIGSERSESGRGMLLANPHYPWVGSNRFWEKQLTIPGQLDVYGAGLLGVPGVAIGFNDAVAWTHTVSSGPRYTLYQVELVDGDPTTYRYDGQPRPMRSRNVSVQVLQEDGTLRAVTRTVYATHHGPVVSLRGFEWDEQYAYAIRDVNADNDEATIQWFEMARAADMDAFQDAHAAYSGMPWVNTISASVDGRAWYTDVSGTPKLSDAAIEAWTQLVVTDRLVAAAARRDIVLLNGSDSRFDWIDDPAARDPGVLPFAELPQLERRDYVFNANDSYWLANSSAPLSGLNGLLARQEATPRSPRTRMNDLVLGDRSPEGPAGADARFSLDELARAAFANRSLTAELLVSAIARRCRANPAVRLDGAPVRLDAACTVLDAFDGHLDLDSRGAVLWREFITQFDRGDLLDAGTLFAEGFDPADPVGTPRGLAPASGDEDIVLQNLARAVAVLDRAGLPLDVPLAELQHADRNGERIPIHGGQGFWEGITNFTSYAANGTTTEPDAPIGARVPGSRYLRTDGYPVNRGTSFIMALEYTEAGPRAVALLTYSQSGDPESEHFADQTRLFSRKQWRPILTTAADIAADPALRTYEVSAGR